ncbi:glycosyltransferase involved in cell wall biosynthesis [Peribacillus deserti]|uniref:Glycosyltransferase involved in cell wall biosynthesis n=1 Tax=Peribacillus deserti TaxID=673318 RepID=A0ABS2QKR5_9BACI|nr:glycosyltransferase [Peribacillus deserti]MBM7693304.1 glycosyltransferase involved in cell wall biosynthesis [Peribacillus deserti]
MLITFEKSIRSYYEKAGIRRLPFIKRLEEEFSLLIKLLENAKADHPIHVSISGLLLELLAKPQFQVEFQDYIKTKKTENVWTRYGWTTPLPALLELSGAKKLIPAATAYSLFPMSLIQTSSGMEYQIQKSSKILTELFQASPKSFYYPYGNYLPGLDRQLYEKGFIYSFINENAFHLRKPDTNEEGYVYSPHGIIMVPYKIYSKEDMLIVHSGGSHPLLYLKSSELKTFMKEEYDHFLDESNYRIWVAGKTSSEHKEITKSYFSYTYNDMPAGQNLFPDSAADLLIKSFSMEREFEHSSEADKKKMGNDWSLFIDGLLTSEQAHNSHPLSADKNNQNGYASQPAGPAHKLNILMLTWEFPPHIIGGLSRHVYGLAKAMSDNGHHLHVLTVRQKGFDEYEVMDNISVHRITPVTSGEASFLDWVTCLNVAMTDKIREICDRESIDIIHAHDWLVAAAALTTALDDMALAVTIHSTEYGRNSGIYSELQKKIHYQEQQLISKADKVIVCSEYMKQELKTVFRCEDKKLVMLPNGITEEEVISQSDIDITRYGADEGIPIVYSWGRAVKEKGIQTLIKAAALLKNKHLKLHIIVSGKGPYLPFLKNLAIEEGVQDDITFTGYVTDDERNRILKHSAAAVFPSYYEPFGIVALEAMAAAKPVIAARTGGLQSIFKHKEEGLLFKPGNPAQLAEMIEFLLTNPAEAERIAEQGKRAALHLYNWSKIGSETEAVFRDILLERYSMRGDPDENEYKTVKDT